MSLLGLVISFFCLCLSLPNTTTSLFLLFAQNNNAFINNISSMSIRKSLSPIVPHSSIFMRKWINTSTNTNRLSSKISSTNNNNYEDGWMNKEEEEEEEEGERIDLLPLSSSDLQRLEDMRKRFKIIPILILDSMLPRQCLEFGSNDPKFVTLIDHALEKGRFCHVDEERLIGMIGLNPTTGRPLNLGVTLHIHEDCVRRENDNIYIAVKGDRRFQVQGEPWLDDTESYYLAEIEFIESREEVLSEEEKEEATKLSNAIPELVNRWLGWVIQTGKSTEAGMDIRMTDIGPIPDEIGERAMWTAALINPLPPLGVCVEIRPAMLACKNDLDRVKLAVAAIRSSIDHLSGKRRLF